MSETRDVGFEVGEGFAGEGANAAHINTVLGKKSGPAGSAFVTTLGCMETQCASDSSDSVRQQSSDRK